MSVYYYIRTTLTCIRRGRLVGASGWSLGLSLDGHRGTDSWVIGGIGVRGRSMDGEVPRGRGRLDGERS